MPWKRALLQKLTITPLFKNFQKSYGTKLSLTISHKPATRACPQPDEYIPWIAAGHNGFTLNCGYMMMMMMPGY